MNNNGETVRGSGAWMMTRISAKLCVCVLGFESSPTTFFGGTKNTLHSANWRLVTRERQRAICIIDDLCAGLHKHASVQEIQSLVERGLRGTAGMLEQSLSHLGKMCVQPVTLSFFVTYALCMSK